MASVLKVNTLTGVTTAGSIVVTGEGNSTTTNLQQGLAKAWANYTSDTTTAYRDSFNFASITDNGTGDTTHTFTNAMSNNDYSVVSSASAVETGTGSLGGSEHPRTYATASFSHVTATGSASLADRPHVNNEVLGDLA